MIIDNLKISVRYPKKSSFLRPKFGQICCRKIAKWEHCIAAEIINVNDSVSLYKNLIEVNAFEEKGYFLGENEVFPNSSRIIHYLLPQKKIIFVTHLSFSSGHTFRAGAPPFSTMFFSSFILHELKFRFNKLKWRDLSSYYFPKFIISDDQLVEKKGKHILQFKFTNLSMRLHSFQINVGLYNSDGKLIGGALGQAGLTIRSKVAEKIKINIPFELPPDCKYIIQPYANTPWLLLFLKKR